MRFRDADCIGVSKLERRILTPSAAERCRAPETAYEFREHYFHSYLFPSHKSALFGTVDIINLLSKNRNTLSHSDSEISVILCYFCERSGIPQV